MPLGEFYKVKLTQLHTKSLKNVEIVESVQNGRDLQNDIVRKLGILENMQSELREVKEQLKLLTNDARNKTSKVEMLYE